MQNMDVSNLLDNQISSQCYVMAQLGSLWTSIPIAFRSRGNCAYHAFLVQLSTEYVVVLAEGGLQIKCLLQRILPGTYE